MGCFENAFQVSWRCTALASKIRKGRSNLILKKCHKIWMMPRPDALRWRRKLRILTKLSLNGSRKLIVFKQSWTKVRLNVEATQLNSSRLKQPMKKPCYFLRMFEKKIRIFQMKSRISWIRLEREEEQFTRLTKFVNVLKMKNLNYKQLWKKQSLH